MRAIRAVGGQQGARRGRGHNERRGLETVRKNTGRSVSASASSAFFKPCRMSELCSPAMSADRNSPGRAGLPDLADLDLDAIVVWME